MRCHLTALALLAALTAPGTATAAEQCDQLDNELNGLLPPEYLMATESPLPLGGAFATARDGADCRNGLRFGTRLATSLVERLAPSCHDLLNPIGSEWLPPAQQGASTVFRGCFDHAWSKRVIRHVYDTSRVCASQVLGDTLTAAAVEYRRCYLEVAEFAAETGSVFVANPFTPEANALVPRDDRRWDELLRSLRTLNGQDSGFIRLACELGKSDAESAMPPRAFLEPCRQ